MRGEIVCLLPEDEELCTRIATERHRLNRQAGRENLLADPTRSALEHELQGVRGEFAVRQFLGLERHFAALCLPKPDGGIDIEAGGYTIDVKFSFYETGLLIFNSPFKFRAHCAVLVCPYETYLLRIAGVVSRKRFFENYTWFESPFHEKPVYSMPQTQLQPVWKLTEYLIKPRNVYAA